MLKKILLLSVFCKVSLFLCFGTMAGCAKEKKDELSTMPETANDTGYKYLALGDSYTIGQSVAETERFPYLTVSLLRGQGFKVSNPTYVAQTGWSTIALQSAIQHAAPLGKYDFVTLLIGVNDQYQHLDTAGYRTRFAQLLDKAIALAGGNKKRVFVLSIPDYSATPFVAASQKAAVKQEIDAFNSINKQITVQQGIVYTDITPLTREAAADNSLLANDGLHYSAKEHARWAEKLLPAIKEALK